MKQNEANYEGWRFGGTDIEFPDDRDDKSESIAFQYPDEEPRPKKPDRREIQVRATEFG